MVIVVIILHTCCKYWYSFFWFLGFDSVVATQQQHVPLSCWIDSSEEHICEGGEKVPNIICIVGVLPNVTLSNPLCHLWQIVVLHQSIYICFYFLFSSVEEQTEDTENAEEVITATITPLNSKALRKWYFLLVWNIIIILYNSFYYKSIYFHSTLNLLNLLNGDT